MREKANKIIEEFENKYQYDIDETTRDWIIFFDDDQDEFLFSLPLDNGESMVMVKKDGFNNWDMIKSKDIDQLIKYAKEKLNYFKK